MVSSGKIMVLLGWLLFGMGCAHAPPQPVRQDGDPFVVRFRGHESIGERRLQRIAQRPEFEEYSPYLVEDLKDAVAALYESRGFARVRVRGTDESSHDRRILTLHVNEGPHFNVGSVAFRGNESYGPEVLREYLVQKPGVFGRDFHARQVATDARQLEDYYIAHGFLDAGVSPSHVLNATAGIASITHTVQEGPRYRLVTVNFSGNTVRSASELLSLTQLVPDDAYDPTATRAARARILDEYRNHGYPHIRVALDVKVNRSDHTVTAAYALQEGREVRVDEVRIRGNEKTKERVIRREVPLETGDLYSRAELYQTRRNVYNIGLFDSVIVEPTGLQQHTATTDVLIQVQEGKNRRLRLGAGYNTEEGFLASMEASYNNLFGLAHEVGVTGGVSTISDEERLFYRVPRLFETRFDGIAEVFRRRKEEPSFTVERLGVGIELERHFGRQWVFKPRYTIENVELTDVEVSPSVEDLRDSEGILSAVGFLLERDSRDSALDPHEGLLSVLEMDVGGGALGGDFDFLKLEFSNTLHIPVTRRTTFVTLLRTGWMEPYGASHDTPLGERFLAGGYGSLRGFPRNEVGPTDEDGEFIGGDALLILNAEYRFPIYKNLLGGVFFDMGNVWRNVSSIDLGETRESAGVGIRYRFPVGVLHMDYGHVLDRKEGEDSGRFHFGIGYSF